MSRRPAVFTCSGSGGVGKSFCRGPAFLLREFLPEGRGVWRGNIPIDVSKLVAFYHRRKRKQSPEETARRIDVIPPDVYLEWQRDIKEGGSGPWDYYRGVDLTGTHFCFDEGHTILGKRHSAQHRDAWRKWLAEIRHIGVTCEFISQDTGSFPEDVDDLGEHRWLLSNCDLLRDPLFNIRLGDWYELRAAITRRYVGSVQQDEQIKLAGRWVTAHKSFWPTDPRYFDLYNSFSKPVGIEGQVGDGAAVAEHQFQRRTVAGVCGWFVLRNFGAVSSRAAIAVAALWFCLGGGQWLFQQVMYTARSAAKANGAGGRDPARKSSAVTMPPNASAPQEPGTSSSVVDPAAAAAPAVTPEQLARDAARLAELEAWAARVTEPASALGVVMLDSCTFRDGATYSVGDVLQRGVNAGYVVTKIDFDRRTVYIRDAVGNVVPLILHRERLRPPEDDDSAAADVLGGVQSGEDVGGGVVQRRGVVPAESHDLGRGHALRGVRPDSRP